MTQYYHQSIMWLLSISEDTGYEDWQYYYYPLWPPGLGCPVEWYLGSIITTLQYLSLFRQKIVIFEKLDPYLQSLLKGKNLI